MTNATLTHGYAAEPPTNPLRREITSIGWVQDGGPLLTLLPTDCPQLHRQKGRTRRGESQADLHVRVALGVGTMSRGRSGGG